jgi:sensor histidine kinase YesM
MIYKTPPLFQNVTELPRFIQYFVQHRWANHALYWLIFVLVSLFSDWSFYVTASINVLTMFLCLFVIMIGSYIQSVVLMPKFLYERKFNLFILGNLLIFILQVGLNYGLNRQLYFSSEYLRTLIKLEDLGLFTGTSVFVFYLLFTPSVKIIKDILLLRQQQQALEKENMKSDLQFMKGQLSPHLLFNTLNNLYGLSLLKSDELPAMMLRLSDVMRYSLYETNQTYVDLNQEITYLKNYL